MNHRSSLVAVVVACAGSATLWYSHHASSPSFAQNPKGEAKRQLLSQIPVWFEETAAGNFAVRSASGHVLLGSQGTTWKLKDGAIHMGWKDSNPSAQKHGMDKLSARIDEYKGNDKSKWRTGIPAYQKVSYESIYPGVDVVFYGKGKQMEHDFVVAPHADPRQIALEFTGASNVAINDSGDLTLSTGKEHVSLTKPVAYQMHGGKRTEVAARFAFDGESARFELGAYDESVPLVIDPVVVYGTYIGGSADDEAVAVAVDLPNDSVWVAGSTTSSDFPTVGSLTGSSASARDVWVAQFINAGSGQLSIAFASNIGGTSDDDATAIGVAPNGLVYVAGNTGSTDFPNIASYTTVYGGGTSDTFVLALDPNQLVNGSSALVYATFVGGSDVDHANGMYIDANSIVYIAGDSVSSDFPTSSGAILVTNRGGIDMIVYKLDTSKGANGLLYSTYFGGTEQDVAKAVTVDANGLIYCAGWTFSPDWPSTGDVPYYTYIGSGDGFLARFDPNKNGLDGISFATYLGGTDYDEVDQMQIGPNGLLYLSGFSRSQDIAIAGNAPQRLNAGGADMFLMILDVTKPSSNWIQFSTYLGGSGDDIPYGMAVDLKGRVNLIGYTHPLSATPPATFKAFPTTSTAVQSAPGGLEDAVMVRIDPTLSAEQSLQFSTFWGGPYNDLGLGIAADPRGCLIHAVGKTSDPNMMVASYAFQTALATAPDAFLVTIDLCNNATGSNVGRARP